MEKTRYPVGARIRAARERRGLHQRDLAALLGVERSTVSQWETGTRRPEAMRLGQIAECLEVPISFLYGTALHDDAATMEDLQRLPPEDRRLAQQFIRLLIDRRESAGKDEPLTPRGRRPSQNGVVAVREVLAPA
jgi:transcriptional regulator with XRE-family HTH domain